MVKSKELPATLVPSYTIYVLKALQAGIQVKARYDEGKKKKSLMTKD